MVDDGAEEPVAELVHHNVALPDDVGADDARVGAVDEDALVFQFVGEVKGEVEEGQLGVGVGAEAVEVLLVHGGEDVVVDFAVADGERHHVDDAAAGGYEGQQLPREQVVPHVVDTHGLLDALFGLSGFVQEDAGIVEQQVHVAESVFDFLREGVDAVERGEVERNHGDGATGLGGEAVADGLPLFGMVAAHDDFVACFDGGADVFLSHSSVGSGDDDDL